MVSTKRGTFPACILCLIGLLILVSLASASDTQTPIGEQIEQLILAADGQRVGMITNPTSLDENLRFIPDLLVNRSDFDLVSFFAPEHGLRGDQQAGQKVKDYVDKFTGLPVYSVYGERKAPTPQQLADIDLLLFDIQDVGTRFYTFVWSMTYCMEAAAAAGKPFLIFDRPNPIDMRFVSGPPIQLDAGLVGRLWPNQKFGFPTRHGMTVAELGRLVNEEWMDPKVDLKVIQVPNLKRSDPFDKDQRKWIAPSPNMPTIDTARVYPGFGMFEGTNVSEGRGTTQPFQMIGSPFVDNPIKLVAELRDLGLNGCDFRSCFFIPTFSEYEGTICGGFEVLVNDFSVFDPIKTSYSVLKTMADLYADELYISGGIERLVGILGFDELIRNSTVEAIIDSYEGDLAEFSALREKYLLYK